MAKKQFKAESKRVLELMINSIYTNREIFLRELISNASDAIDKLYFRSLDENSSGEEGRAGGLSRSDFEILISVDKDARTLTVTDNGCGMNQEELEKNLGTIARSGTLSFREENADKLDDLEVIGQFGVGFYAAFMVAKRVTVISRAYGSDETFKWVSDGVDGYTMSPAERDSHGTDIIMELKDDTEDDKFGEYLDQYKITELVKKYSDYIRYPIKTMKEKRRPKEGEENEYESYFELDTLNSMTPIWKRSRSEVTDEEYKEFYKGKFYDFQDPTRIIHTSAEGLVSYTALMFIPAKAPYNYYTKDFKRGLQLYTNGVLIMDSCEDLLPDYFGFVSGIVDSPDVSLNISREVLQQDRQLKTIAKGLERRIKSELQKMQTEEREKYNEFWKEFGLPIKYGVYQDFGANKDGLKDLLLFDSLLLGKPVTLSEYVSNMPESQSDIYYACGESLEKIAALPQLELLKDKGYDLLCMTADVDEFVVKMLGEYEEKKFKSATADDLDLASEDEKKKTEEQSTQHKEMLGFMKEKLAIAGVKLSSRLKSHPVCLSTEGELSLEMEKVLSSMPGNSGVKAQRVLELNSAHPVFGTLCALYESDRDRLEKYASLLYTQALLIEGMDIDDPAGFSNDICELMVGNV